MVLEGSYAFYITRYYLLHFYTLIMSTGLAKLTENKLFELLNPKRQDLIRMIGEDRMKREASFALQAINASDYLGQATPVSVAKCIFNLALTGLSLNPISKLAYITPRRIGNDVEAVLMPSYQGLVKLITDTGSVKTVYAYCVYEGDEFLEVLGTAVEIIHKPKRLSKNITLVYAVAILPDGTKLVEVMDKVDVYDIRERSDSYKAYKAGKVKSAIWVTDEGEMFRKTVIKRITKYVPKTDKWNQVNEAIAIDNDDYPATHNQEDYVLSLVESSTYDQDSRDIIRAKVEDGISHAEAQTIIEDLKNNQLDPVTQGANYSVTEAKEKLNEITK